MTTSSLKSLHINSHNIFDGIGNKDWVKISKNKQLSINEILIDPSILFQIVFRNDISAFCECCKYEDVEFIDLLRKHYTLDENDYVNIGEKVNLNWEKLSRYFILSNETLMKFRDKVDWKYISEYHDYKKNIEFIILFHDKIKWDKFSYLGWHKESVDVLKDMIFNKKYIPIKYAIQKQLLSKEIIIDKIELICNNKSKDIVKLLLHYYGPYVFESKEPNEFGEIFYEFNDILRNTAKEYLQGCIKHKYIPSKYVYVLYDVKDIQNGNWIDFIKHISPGVTFLEKYVIKNANEKSWIEISKISGLPYDFILKYEDKLDWNSLIKSTKFTEDILEKNIHKIDPAIISKYQDLSPEFIDKYCDRLDWHYICEFQKLTEWLMRKHSNKLDWGQTSWYQKLSKTFIEDYKDRLNHIKLSYNKNI